MNTLDFSYNWNGKLTCQFFTTLRLSGRLNVGEWLLINLKSKVMGRALVIDKKMIKVGNLTTWICGIDTGYSIDETKAILKRMYPNKINDDTVIYYYLLRYETTKELNDRENVDKSAQKELFQ